jgi:hypothetical protein
MRRAALVIALLLPFALAGCGCDTDPDDVVVDTDEDDDGFDGTDHGGDDCDDDDPDIHPGADETCNGLDDDCDGLVDEDEDGVEDGICPPEDADGDGYPDGEDCDDSDPDVHPGADEECNGIDDDCDGVVDEDTDLDGDGISDCADGDGDGWSGDQGDCDDTNAAISPDANEACNGIDDDCDGVIDEGYDIDGDGVADCFDDCPVYVDIANADAVQDGTFGAPFAAIQDGMDTAAAAGCRYVDVHPGTYFETIDFSGWDLEVVAVGGRTLTTIDAEGTGTVVTANSGEPDTALLQGFTITGGSAENGGGLDLGSADLGGALHVLSNEIMGNEAVNDGVQGGFGGGIRMLFSDSVIEDNLIHDNDASLDGPEEGCDGGGIAAVFGAPEIIDNQITGNVAGDGGGIWLAKSDALVVNNLVAGNVARDQGGDGDHDGGQGGGINLQVATDDTLVANNVIADNEADAIGGGLVVFEFNADFGNGAVINNTIVFNSLGAADAVGAGLAIWINVAPDVRNNLVAFNDGDGVHTHATALATPSGEAVAYGYNDVFGNDVAWSGAVDAAPATCFAADPLFAAASDDGDHSNDDFNLGAGSAAVDGGDPDGAFDDVDGSRSDVGAYGGPDGDW